MSTLWPAEHDATSSAQRKGTALRYPSAQGEEKPSSAKQLAQEPGTSCSGAHVMAYGWSSTGSGSGPHARMSRIKQGKRWKRRKGWKGRNHRPSNLMCADSEHPCDYVWQGHSSGPGGGLLSPSIRVHSPLEGRATRTGTARCTCLPAVLDCVGVRLSPLIILGQQFQVCTTC